MRTQTVVVPIAALVIALGSFSVEADEGPKRRPQGSQDQAWESSRRDDSAVPRSRQDDRTRGSSDRGAQRADRGSQANQPQDQERERGAVQSRQRDREMNRGDGSSARYGQGGAAAGPRDSRNDYRGSRDSGGSRGRDTGQGYDRSRSYDRGNYGGYDGGYSRGYYAPRLLPRRSASRRSYGSGGRLSLYFGIGSGYRYGSPYSGRVYGDRRYASGYRGYRDYGDVRLRVSPRDAAVYVDGYYAGIVDDFDGFFQRLTLEVGPHEIEIEAPGLDSQVFDVYVDPSRTIDLRADLLR